MLTGAHLNAEARLYETLDTNRDELAVWLDDRRSLGAFARARGHRSLPALARVLLAPRLRTASRVMARRLRSALSPQRIAVNGGRTLREAREALRILLWKRGDQAARTGEMSVAQAAALFAHQEAGLDVYMRRRYRTPAQQVEFVCRLK